MPKPRRGEGGGMLPSTAPLGRPLRELLGRLLGEGFTPPWMRRWNTRTMNAKSLPANSPSGIAGAPNNSRADSSMPQVLKNRRTV